MIANEMNQRQLERLKDSLEDIELFLKEIEDILETLEWEITPDVEIAYRLRLVQLQQHIETINNSFLIPQKVPPKRLMS